MTAAQEAHHPIAEPGDVAKQFDSTVRSRAPTR